MKLSGNNHNWLTFGTKSIQNGLNSELYLSKYKEYLINLRDIKQKFDVVVALLCFDQMTTIFSYYICWVQPRLSFPVNVPQVCVNV